MKEKNSAGHQVALFVAGLCPATMTFSEPLPARVALGIKDILMGITGMWSRTQGHFIHSLTHSFTCYPGWLWIQVRETRQTGLPPRTPTPAGGLLPTGQRRSASGVMPALGLSRPQVPCLCNGAITALLTGHPVLAMLLGVHVLSLCPAPGCPVAHDAQVRS